MLDRLHDYADCFDDPGRWAIATIVEVSGSVPRPAGTSMAVRDDGRTIGSVSGGCVEGAVVDAAIGCLQAGTVELHSFGYADDDGISIGLMCGGDVRVLVQPVVPGTVWIKNASATGLREAFLIHSAGMPVRLVRELPAGDSSVGARLADEAPAIREDALCVAFVGPELPADVIALGSDAAARVRAALTAGGAHVVEITDRTRPECPVVRRLLVESTESPARLIIYGANDFSAALAQAAAVLGRHVTVCDARPVFATRARHPGAHEVVLGDPGAHFAAELAAGRIDGRTAIAVLTHDPRFDLPVLEKALPARLGYVGAMGSRTTHEKRMQELRACGLGEDLLERLHSPIGLDIGARTPAEVAVSILAEIVLAESAVRAGVSPVRMLRDTAGDVHDVRRTCAPDPGSGTRAEEAMAWM